MARWAVVRCGSSCPTYAKQFKNVISGVTTYNIQESLVANFMPLKSLIFIFGLIVSPVLLADDWGGWNQLPDNLLREGDEFESLSELSEYLDSLLTQGNLQSSDLPPELISDWLSALGQSDDASIQQLERLLESQNGSSDDDDVREWHQSLEDSVENLLDDVEIEDEFEEEDEIESEDP